MAIEPDSGGGGASSSATTTTSASAATSNGIAMTNSSSSNNNTNSNNPMSNGGVGGGGNKYNVRPEVLSRIRAALSDTAYREVIESSSQYNNGIVVERKLRLPYLDSQTGVAQSDCCLWMHRKDRMPGEQHGQLYSYPSKRWKKKRRQYLMNDNYLAKVKQRECEGVADSDSNHAIMPGGVAVGGGGSGGGSGGGAGDSNTSVKSEANNDSADKFGFDNSKDAWYGDFDDGSDLPDAGELDDPESDFDDYEEYGSKKKKKKKEPKGKRSRVEYTDAEKPYACDICGARYKTRPGLSYHYSHSHQNEGAPPMAGTPGRPEDGDEVPYATSRTAHSNGPSGASLVGPGGGGGGGGMPPGQLAPGQLPPGHPAAGPLHRNSPIPPHLPPSASSAPGGAPPVGGGGAHAATNNSSSNSSTSGNVEQSFEGNRPHSGKPLASPSSYCDFCLGDSIENKKTKEAESLVSCSDCGRSAHPTCLQFTDNMIASVKKYRWQCIECKSCGLCGTSDNDDQLLFCDDCDRGYHMYCLNPPLSEPPEGSWSCHLCIIEYHTPKSKA